MNVEVSNNNNTVINISILIVAISNNSTGNNKYSYLVISICFLKINTAPAIITGGCKYNMLKLEHCASIPH